MQKFTIHSIVTCLGTVSTVSHSWLPIAGTVIQEYFFAFTLKQGNTCNLFHTHIMKVAAIINRYYYTKFTNFVYIKLTSTSKFLLIIRNLFEILTTILLHVYIHCEVSKCVYHVS